MTAQTMLLCRRTRVLQMKYIDEYCPDCGNQLVQRRKWKDLSRKKAYLAVKIKCLTCDHVSRDY